MALLVCQWLLFVVDCLSLLCVVYLLFVVVGCWCLLLVIRSLVVCWLFVVHCLFIVHCLLFIVYCLLFVGCCLSVVGCSFVGLSFSHSLVIQSFIGCLLVYRFISG